MTQNIRKYKSFIFIALVGVLFYFFVTLFKYAMGPDERAYFSLGLYLRETGGYYSPKHHPLYSILMSLSSLLGLSALGVTKIVFIFSGMILWISIYWLFINIGYDKVRYKLFQAIFVGTLPGTSSLILYSGSSLVYTAIITASIALTLFAYKKDLNILYFLCGTLYGLSYLARIDGLVLFGFFAIYFVLNDGRTRWHKLLLVIFGFVVTILPWQLFLYSNQLFLSTVVVGGWDSSVWTDGPMKYILNGGGELHLDVMNLSMALNALSKNILLYSQHIGSIRVFPFFYIAFIGLALLCKDKLRQIVIVSLPIIATLPYILFYVEARYLAPATTFLGVLAALGLINVIQFLEIKSRLIYPALISLNLILVFSYLYFGHETYFPYR